jgi:hypothetical protein
MSLAHLKAPKVGRTRTAATTPSTVPKGPRAYCGASREPLYRTMDEASESGLEICDTCLADFRKKR